MFGCFLMNGKEWTIFAKCVCISETLDDAINKSNKLEEKGILTIVREI